METGFLGIDVSKGYADFIPINSKKEELTKPFKLFDNRQGHEKMPLKILRLKQKFGLKKVYCGVESTGGYENNWYRTRKICAEVLFLRCFN